MRSQFMELKVQWPLANPDIFLSDTAALSCYDFRPGGSYGDGGDFGRLFNPCTCGCCQVINRKIAYRKYLL